MSIVVERMLRSPLTILPVALALLAACSTPPTDLDLSRDKPSDGGLYRVSVVAPSPAAGINQLHSWKVRLFTAGGQPVSNAQFLVGGGMPQHGHGYPTQPRVTRELEAGTYLLEGMKFSMTGWWELKLGIRAAPGADHVTFNLVVGSDSGQ
ncbi:FixH family protein [Pseudomonas sp. QL9]|uniref:FixH family protein n=1 Tax=Pseudomonas TaxID=286 RepID=UPI00352B264C